MGGEVNGGGCWEGGGGLHVVEGARALAVDTFAVVGANDDVAEGGAVFEDEDGILLAALGLLVAGRGLAVPLDHLAIEALAGCNGADGRQSGGAGGSGELGLQVGVLGRGEAGRQDKSENREHAESKSEV